MNERIKELADEATTIVNAVPNKSMAYSYFDTEKFAELLIKQCGYYADVFESAGCPVDMDPAETKPSDYIKKYFGVE